MKQRQDPIAPPTDPASKSPSPVESSPAEDKEYPASQPSDHTRHLAKDAKAPGKDLPEERAAEFGGPRGPEPTRFGDWEQKGRCSDF